MSFKELVLASIFWAQICLVLGVFSGALTVKEFITIQISLIMLIVPSPILQNKRDKENND